ncbi:helix-turn-helix domain-containing protein [Sphingomonas sp. HDW15A]|uniref:GlxA family transcriptional regulator n=1 Tax=Sphingomonas sp. HDW15A TaxID=2714942 RepID=UPI00140CCB16|nr:helix-turn-helix domain-containing protein [Sphingomonas sp. HDW15A]QIK95930.1 helix-turn-helix domain-containing protein [Sphingomonas sp. HDW15A]
MADNRTDPLEALIVAVPETAGSALYGMLDVLAATGNIWQQLVGGEESRKLIRPRIVSAKRRPFLCGNNIPVRPDCCIADDPKADIIILPELWLGPDENISGRYDAIVAWIRQRYQAGTSIYSACSGAIMLAETGLLNGRPATSHWGYERLFRTRYPKVLFKPEPALQFADPAGRIVTAGGTTSWHDLALHIIARHCSPGEAARIAKVYLLKTHDEGQLPYAALVKQAPHADAAVRECEAFLKKNCLEECVVIKAVAQSRIPERTLKRRFKNATGLSIIHYVQNLRIEKAKQLLETTDLPIDEIGGKVGYENLSFFRQLFRRRCGLSPANYRRLFNAG